MELTHRVVLMTAPDAQTGERLARKIVEAGLAACVNVVPGVKSVYRWKGKIETDAEVLLVAKTLAPAVERLVDFVKANHPYELAEVLALPVISGSPAYLQWVAEDAK